MKKLLLLILLTINLTNTFGQNTNEEKYRFAKEVFNSKKYKKDNYPRFQQNIQLVGDSTYQFGEKILTLSIENKSYEKLFKKGIFNPDVVFGAGTTKRDQSQLDTLTQVQKIVYNLVRNDSLSICCFEELEKLNPNPQTKRFIFWLLRIGVANPTEYYLEFYNKKATKETSIEEFIENAKMTFYYQGTTII
ncbi:hypothetical protein MH928_16145 [Flavobacterium sp. WW92]|uniref:hypothetical protein n=1 Tax=unclassified Flavobacterium TaxID=196869 RepID=UPI0022251DCF|nr:MULTISPECIES: hypothetical protein [unclassified Flavobacterium]WDO12842.1 hypothetical protein MH928_16145 [Flavobacterium sp. WW92]